MEKKIVKTLTVYLPNGEVKIFTQHQGEVEDIMLLNGGVAVIYINGCEEIFSNMPFVYEH